MVVVKSKKKKKKEASNNTMIRTLCKYTATHKALYGNNRATFSTLTGLPPCPWHAMCPQEL